MHSANYSPSIELCVAKILRDGWLYVCWKSHDNIISFLFPLLPMLQPLLLPLLLLLLLLVLLLACFGPLLSIDIIKHYIIPHLQWWSIQVNHSNLSWCRPFTPKPTEAMKWNEVKEGWKGGGWGRYKIIVSKQKILFSRDWSVSIYHSYINLLDLRAICLIIPLPTEFLQFDWSVGHHYYMIMDANNV